VKFSFGFGWGRGGGGLVPLLSEFSGSAPVIALVCLIRNPMHQQFDQKVEDVLGQILPTV